MSSSPTRSLLGQHVEPLPMKTLYLELLDHSAVQVNALLLHLRLPGGIHLQGQAEKKTQPGSAFSARLSPRKEMMISFKRLW